MSLEQALADAATQVGLAREAITGFEQVATDQIERVTDEHLSIINKQTLTVYVDQQAGDDEGEGKIDSPLQSISKALSFVPMGGKCKCVLKAAYNFSDELLVDGKVLELTSDSAVRHRLTFDTDTFMQGVLYRKIYGIRLHFGALVSVRSLTLVMPAAVGGSLPGAADHYAAAMFRSGNVETQINCGISLTYCDLEWPASPMGPLAGFGSFVSLLAAGCVETDQPMLGQWIIGETNPAGVATTNIPYLQTNLSTV